MNYRKATLGIAILTGALAVVVWDMRKQQSQVKTVAIRSDYRMQDFQIQAFSENGNLAFSLRAPLLERNIDGKSVDIQKPVFEFPDKDEQSWTAVSDNAWVSDRAHEVQLRNNVLISGPTSPLGLKTEITIDQISIFPKEKRMASDRRVTIRHGTTILEGTGLDADMDERRVRLLAEVKARYVPTPP
jgi:lipopolysaccharide export system protein LptC